MKSVAKVTKEFLLIEIWDYLLIFMIVALTVLGRDGFPVAELALAIPLVMQFIVPGRSPYLPLSRIDLVFGFLALQYFVLHWFIAISYPLNNDPIQARWIEYPHAWAIAMLLMVLVFWRFTMIRNLQHLWRYMAPAGLIFSFLVLSIDYFTAFRGSECRVSGYVFNPTVPPVFFTIFTIGSFFGWAGFTKGQRLLRYLLVVMAVIVTTAYAGARMTLLVQIFAFGLLSLILPARDTKERIQLVAVLGGLGVLGVAIGLGFDIIADCSFAKRLSLMVEVAGEPAEPGQNSISIRIDLAKQALALMAQNPWTGFGISAEKLIAAPEYHIHNQYFSWMIWGGVISLISGTAYLVSPSIALLISPTRDGLILSLAISGIIAVNSISDSLLYHDYVNVEFILALGLFYGLGRCVWAKTGKANSDLNKSAEVY